MNRKFVLTHGGHFLVPLTPFAPSLAAVFVPLPSRSLTALPLLKSLLAGVCASQASVSE